MTGRKKLTDEDKKKPKPLTNASSLYKVVQHVLKLMFHLKLSKILNHGSISSHGTFFCKEEFVMLLVNSFSRQMRFIWYKPKWLQDVII